MEVGKLVHLLSFLDDHDEIVHPPLDEDHFYGSDGRLEVRRGSEPIGLIRFDNETLELQRFGTPPPLGVTVADAVVTSEELA